jgi:peptide/nickel transport system permease protein
MGRIRIALRHILPNVIGPILILASMDIPAFIMAEAGISFLGVGVKAPATSWGMILDQGFRYIGHTPWLVIAGGLPLILATLGFTFLGEALRDAFDPRLKRRG